MVWEEYDPEWLAQLAEQQRPNESWLPEAIRRCTRCYPKNESYYYFVSNEKANQSGSEWQFDYNITLGDKRHGIIILDILKGNRVGGFEFIDKYY
jgi:hypothetical protein